MRQPIRDRTTRYRARRRCDWRSRARGCARTARGRDPRSSIVPEVEQAPGDDVALDLRSAAVDRGRPRVQELGTPALALDVVATDDLRRQRVGGEVEQRLLCGREQHLVD